MAKTSSAGSGNVSVSSLGAGSIGSPRTLPSPIRTINIGEFMRGYKKRLEVKYEIKRPKISYDRIAPMEVNYQISVYGREKLPIFYSGGFSGTYRSLGTDGAYALPLQSFQSSYNQPRSSKGYKIQPASYKQAEKYSLN